nr:secretoglobin family 1D member 2-like isoform X1 [Equus caballus]
MRLSLSVLLVTLALCYYDAGGVICPAAVTDTTAFLTFNKPLYKLQAGRFDAPPEAVKAKLETKKCADKISIGNRWLILKALVTSSFLTHGCFCSGKSSFERWLD